ncbi:MAG: hypothetical protein JSW68_12250 [Burkholderiales bacterium]|nr:MAG: hypothetical protein JSW68_12250 [Burkholderiales bacterium]
MIRLGAWLVALLLFSSACAATGPQTSYQGFWARFRQAVLDDDRDRVVSLMRLPFEVRGPDDAQPVRRLDRAGFLEIYDRLVLQELYLPQGGALVVRTMRALIEQRPDASEDDLLTEGIARFHQFQFERIGDHWRFTRAYLEE